jgi:hypothetical protein
MILFIILAIVLLAFGVALITDAGLRLYRGERR